MTVTTRTTRLIIVPWWAVLVFALPLLGSSAYWTHRAITAEADYDDLALHAADCSGQLGRLLDQLDRLDRVVRE